MPPPWHQSHFVRTALPMFGFVLACWYGLGQLMESKLRIRQSVRGYDKVEEYDPMEALRRLEGRGGGGGGTRGGGGDGGAATSSLDNGGGRGGSGGPAAAAAGAATTTAAAAPLEDELAAMLRGVDLGAYENLPVPRLPDDDEE